MSHESRLGFSGNVESGILPPPRNTKQMLFVPDGTQKKETDPTVKISDLVPGDVITFADIKELTEFEDLIATEIDPKHNKGLWAARPKLRDLLRPKFKNGGAFNGRITNIQLIVMADPYERLLDAKDRSWKGQAGGKTRIGRNHKLSPDMAELLRAKYRGFCLIADPVSSRSGELGQIQAELWYFPVPPVVAKADRVWVKAETLKSGEVRYRSYIKKAGTVSSRGIGEGKGLNRVVTQP